MSHGLESGAAKNLKRMSMTLTTTTTTVMSTKQTILTFVENLVATYKKKKKAAPCLWLWFPLLLAILLTSLISKLKNFFGLQQNFGH